MESECRILLEVICMYGWTVGQPESKLSGQLRCTALLPSSSNFLKPNIPSPKIGLLIGNYEVYCILDKIGALHWTVIGCYHSSAMLSDSLIRLTLARLHKNDSRVKIIPIEGCSWDCSLKETSKFLSITDTMIKWIKALTLWSNGSKWMRYICWCPKCLNQIYGCQKLWGLLHLL